MLAPQLRCFNGWICCPAPTNRVVVTTLLQDASYSALEIRVNFYRVGFRSTERISVQYYRIALVASAFQPSSLYVLTPKLGFLAVFFGAFFGCETGASRPRFTLSHPLLPAKSGRTRIKHGPEAN